MQVNILIKPVNKKFKNYSLVKQRPSIYLKKTTGEKYSIKTPWINCKHIETIPSKGDNH